MNQVLEFLAENYIYVAGGSAVLIVILLLIIAFGNKKKKKNDANGMNVTDASVLQPQSISEISVPNTTVSEPVFEQVPFVNSIQEPVNESVPVQEMPASTPVVEPVVPVMEPVNESVPVQEMPASTPVVEEKKDESLEVFGIE